MAEGARLRPGTSTVTQTVEETTQGTSPAVKLKLKKPKNDRKVKWEEGTVDNEHMDKKKSKCCCIYHKPRLFGESSSDESGDDDCTNHCRGHKKKCFRGDKGHDNEGHEEGEGAAGSS